MNHGAGLQVAKAHGLGNDFLLVAADKAPLAPATWVPRLCDRHTGLGADGVLFYAVENHATAHMRLLNADGGDAEISGNGLRCLSAFLVRAGQLDPRHVVHTAVGPRACHVCPIDDHGEPRIGLAQEARAFKVSSDLGVPILASRDIPLRLDEPLDQVVNLPLDVDGRRVEITATSLGNPHCAVFFPAPVSDAVLRDLGPRLEQHPLFPRRTNVEFVTVVAPDELRVRFWERGVGCTSASGTGAASAALAAALNGRAERRVRVVCDGGVLEVEWPADGPIRQTGQVELVFEGRWFGL
jgi:diaminopimelate epimerase